MRPVKKGKWPTNQFGYIKLPADYRDFLPDLKADIGHYCSYCECRTRSLDVEHVIPKSINPQKLEYNWYNLLLSCPKCNRDYKKDWNPSRRGYVWPDTHDTFDIYEYHCDGSMSVNSSVAPYVRIMAQNTIDLMHLNSTNSSDDELVDMRAEMWETANEDLEDYNIGKKLPDQVAKHAKKTGYWSIWMTVFKDHPEVTQKIADAFPGTLPKYCTPPANP